MIDKTKGRHLGSCYVFVTMTQSYSVTGLVLQASQVYLPFGGHRSKKMLLKVGIKTCMCVSNTWLTDKTSLILLCHIHDLYHLVMAQILHLNYYFLLFGCYLRWVMLYSSYVGEVIVKILGPTFKLFIFHFWIPSGFCKKYQKIAQREVSIWRPDIGIGLHLII